MDRSLTDVRDVVVRSRCPAATAGKRRRGLERAVMAEIGGADMKQILVATDFSERSHRAVRRARLLAREPGARLLLLHVVDDDRPQRLVAGEAAAARECSSRPSARCLTACDARRTWRSATRSTASRRRARDRGRPHRHGRASQAAPARHLRRHLDRARHSRARRARPHGEPRSPRARMSAPSWRRPVGALRVRAAGCARVAHPAARAGGGRSRVRCRRREQAGLRGCGGRPDRSPCRRGRGGRALGSRAFSCGRGTRQ